MEKASHVLIIETDPFSAFLTQYTLEKFGTFLNIKIVPTLKEALEYLRHTAQNHQPPPDFILMDMKGMEIETNFLEILHKRFSDTTTQPILWGMTRKNIPEIHQLTATYPFLKKIINKPLSISDIENSI